MSPHLTALITNVSMALITFLSGSLIAATPWLTRGREAFAVSVPEAAQEDPRIRRMRQVYLACVLAISAASAVATLVLSSTYPIAMAAVVCVPASVGFALMLVFRSRVQAIKRAEGWETRTARLAAVAGTAEANAPRPLSPSWNLLYLPVILATLGLTLALYPSMPDPVPVHFDAAGAVDDYMAKGWQVVAMPIAVQAFMALCLTASHWQILRSRRPTSPEHPVASAIACSLQFLSAGQATYDRALASEERMTITVTPDDTLWAIAEAHPADNVSTRQTVDIVRAWNDLSDGMLRAGETLVVPA